MNEEVKEVTTVTKENTSVITPLEDAQTMVSRIQSISRETIGCFLQLGLCLKEAKEKRHWDILGFDGWDEYLEDLGLRVDAAAKLIDVVTYVWALPFVQATDPLKLKETTLIRLIPMARRGELTEEKWAHAITLRDSDLRILLGHEVEPRQGTPREIRCPRCGNSFPLPGKEGHARTEGSAT